MTPKTQRPVSVIVATLAAFTLAFALWPATALAAPGDTGTTGIWNWMEQADGSLTITSCTAPTGDLTLPDMLGTKSVTQIGHNAFQNCTGLTGIVLPDSVMAIGDSAFDGCTALASITLPDGLKSIGVDTFSNCVKLTGIAIPDTVSSIGISAFNGCSILESVTLPHGLTAISDNLFCNCTKLADITIPATVTSIGVGAFICCGSLANITLPDGLKSIGLYGFYYCTKLTNITIPDTVTSMDTEVFYGCSGLISVTLPHGITSIGIGMFMDCTSLAGIAIPCTVTSIGDVAFEGCTTLADITLPDGLTSIGDKAFDGCSNLTRIMIPNDTMSFGGNDVFLDSNISSDGIYAHDGSTAFIYATAHEIPFHTSYTVQFNSNGGTAIADVLIGSGNKLAAPANPANTGFVFDGWYKESTFDTLWDFGTETVTAAMTLYARWSPVLTLTPSPANGMIYTGGRITITPNVDGGSWTYDHTLLSLSGNEFTGLKAGTAHVTYDVDGQSASADVIIRQAQLPATGQDFTPSLWLLALGVLAGAASAILAVKEGVF
jgi:uncharacterized repeat protein (TIGR02543 family)